MHDPMQQRELQNKQFRFHIGTRTLKSAISAMLCAMIYFAIGRNPTFACIGAIFGIGGTMDESWRGGGNRLIGTIIGGVIGMAFYAVYLQFYPNGGYHWLLFPLLFVGVVVLILACQIFHWPGGVQPGGVVLCIILFNTPVETFVAYSLNRMLDTGIGVLVSLIITLLLPHERMHRWFNLVCERLHIPAESVKRA